MGPHKTVVQLHIIGLLITRDKYDIYTFGQSDYAICNLHSGQKQIDKAFTSV